MVQTTVYKCDICGTEYTSSDACEKCETLHKVGYTNANRDKYSRMKAYPDSITVQFADDSEDKYVTYSYSHQYTYKAQSEE